MAADFIKLSADQLLSSAREFQNFEDSKSISNFNCIGQILLKEDEIEAICKERVKERKSRELLERLAGRNRDKSFKEEHGRVVIPVTEHPMYQPLVTPPVFFVSAADKVHSLRTLLEDFVFASRSILRINRVKRRLSKAMQKLKEVSNSSAKAPVLIVGKDESSEFPTSKIENFDQLELKIPFHFKQMGYSQHLLPEHPFLNSAHLEVPHQFPFRNDEPEGVDLESLPQSCVINSFQPTPVNPNAQFPTTETAFIGNCRTDLFPYSHQQIEDCGGAAPAFFDLQFGKSQLPLATQSHNLISSFANSPLPKILLKGKKEDVLSDTDDEDAPEVSLDCKHPTSLLDVTNIFAPSLSKHFLVNGKCSNVDNEDVVVPTQLSAAIESLIPIKDSNCYADSLSSDVLQDRIQLFDSIQTGIVSRLPLQKRKLF